MASNFHGGRVIFHRMALGEDDPAMAARMIEELVEIERAFMPFGKFGPGHFPPSGLPLFELPAEYLAWFAQKGWPRGRLGYLLRVVYQMKVDGAGAVFDEMRRRAGGRPSLRAPGT